MANGVQFVMTGGTIMMLMLCADSWDFLVIVKHYQMHDLGMVVGRFFLITCNVWAMRDQLLIAQLMQLAITTATIVMMLVSVAIYIQVQVQT